MRRAKDYASRGIAKRAEENIAINNGDLSSLTSAVQSLQIKAAGMEEDISILTQSVTSITEQIASIQTSISNINLSISSLSDMIAATNQSYSTHTHAYTDIDQTGSALSKNTETPS